uniref:Uncharacterized protein n=1 Tax=Vitis vinifera TaxID=29760 RepID=A5ATJ0_VITVI|nr:hypothetical protein VITISV_010058 [Vitis vinifera]
MARPEEQRPRWTEEEDRMLFECKGRNLDLPWPDIAELAGLSRSGKSCRDRWKNHLDPNVKRGNFSQEEDETIIRLHSSHENSWAFIATHLPGRTDNAVKNRWNNHLKNKLIGRSTDHQNILTHKSDDETIHHAFGGDYFASEPTQLFHLNYNIDPNPSSSSIPTPVSASQEIANPWSSFELACSKFPRGYLPIDCETIHHSLGGNYFEFEPTQLFHLNHNIDPNASSSSIPTPVSASQDISSPWSTSEFAYTEFSGDIFRVMMRSSITLSGEITLSLSPHNSFISTTILIQKQAQARFLHWFQPHKKSSTLELAGLSRSGKSCRERWKNHLDSNVKRGNFSQEEDETIIRLHSSHGNSWAFIATHLPGRTDNALKNRWNHHLKNKLIGRGIDHQNIPDPQSSTGDYFEPWISGPVSASVENAFMPTEQVTRNWST